MGSSGDSKKTIIIIVALLAIIAAAGWMFKSSRGDSDDAASRAAKHTNESIAQEIQSSNIPEQAKAAAMAAARAHGAEAATHK